MVEQLVNVGEEGRVPLQQLSAAESFARAVAVRVGHGADGESGVDAAEDGEQRSGAASEPDYAKTELLVHRDASVDAGSVGVIPIRFEYAVNCQTVAAGLKPAFPLSTIGSITQYGLITVNWYKYRQPSFSW